MPPSLAGEINYGGRVTDDNDRRLLLCCLSRSYNAEVLRPGHAYSPSGLYRAPDALDQAGYVAAIQALPHLDDPEVFGLHANANITFNLQVRRGHVICTSHTARSYTFKKTQLLTCL